MRERNSTENIYRKYSFSNINAFFWSNNFRRNLWKKLKQSTASSYLIKKLHELIHFWTWIVTVCFLSMSRRNGNLVFTVPSVNKADRNFSFLFLHRYSIPIEDKCFFVSSVRALCVNDKKSLVILMMLIICISSWAVVCQFNLIKIIITEMKPKTCQIRCF